MFSVATLTLASPVYLRLWEGPGLAGMLWLVLLLQALPTAGLVLADVWLEGRWRRAWYGWRGVLLAASLVTVVRQAQIYFRMPTSPVAWLLVAACVAAILGLLRVGGVSLSRFLVAFAPGVLVWTLVTGYTLWPPSDRTVRHAAPSPPPAVFVLLFDELDRDAVMPGGRVRPELPNFRRLLERSRAFADATANYGTTCP